ncbi:hypothetical protein BJQ94_16080 [Cryobacterium sp. SO2]|uniref:hypothetical protein n=1 Tax=Cryobacterium sp. SO2 TaxID=1897060 RepID=UPI00223D8F44|nr:hypothetical protein [Cryobacterium sp. SO2]WEO76858.1 hypothetical protein BJQ94_16080 [Cryobacterium sp. SO2]
MDVGAVGTVLGAGLLAGWGVAVPLGAIGLLLVREGLTAGLRTGAVAAAAVAAVDGVYCTMALVLGAVAAPLLATWGAASQVLAGVVLMVMGGAGLMRLATPGRPGAALRRRPAGRVFVTFVGLTAINPTTLAYFLVLTAAIPSAVGVQRWPAVFVAGAVAASLVWQLALVAVGAFWGGRISDRGQAVLSGCGFGLVALLGVAAVGTALG